MATHGLPHFPESEIELEALLPGERLFKNKQGDGIGAPSPRAWKKGPRLEVSLAPCCSSTQLDEMGMGFFQPRILSTRTQPCPKGCTPGLYSAPQGSWEGTGLVALTRDIPHQHLSYLLSYLEEEVHGRHSLDVGLGAVAPRRKACKLPSSRTHISVALAWHPVIAP